MRWQKRHEDESRVPKKPVTLAGETLRVELATDADQRDRAFRALRGLLPPGHQGRVTIHAVALTVDGLRPEDVAVLRDALNVIGEKISPASPPLVA